MVLGAEGGIGMKRTPLWVFVAAVGIQIAALGLCIWAMENFGHLEGDRHDEDEPAPPAPPREALNPAPQTVAADAAFVPRERQTEPEPVLAYRPTAPPPAAPLFGPPPDRPPEATAPPPEPAAPAIPESPAEQPAPRPSGGDLADLRYVTEPADDATQIVHGESDGRIVAFGFYADGNIRFVDVDGGRYAGKADSARARMREAGGTRAITVQIGIAADGRLQATFTGGLHDAETLPLEPLVGWSVA
jgi:hypothetical protein